MKPWSLTYEGVKVTATKKAPYVLVSQVVAGAWADGVHYDFGEINNCSTTGHKSIEALVLDPEVAEGAIVIDRRDDVLSMSGPMLDQKLPAKTVGHFFQTKQVKSLAEVEGLPFLNCSVDLYTDYWKAKGARIGRKLKGVLVWASNTKE